MKAVYFVTTNDKKFRDYKDVFLALDVGLVQANVELSELQTVDGFDIAQHKLEQAKVLLPDKQVMVDDRGFAISALGNFPGPMLKLTLATIGVEGLLVLLRDKQDRTAEFTTTVGYFDGVNDHIFEVKERGFLTTERQGENLRGWTELMYIYGHDNFPGRSLASLDDDDWQKYLDVIAEDSIVTQLARVAIP
jgi:non-canonical purine NTP pyrophosphatase (RdgB/HAM1 family)